MAEVALAAVEAAIPRVQVQARLAAASFMKRGTRRPLLLRRHGVTAIIQLTVCI
jgi:hypothetical protein